MKRKQIKGLAVLAVVLCINSVPIVAHANTTTSNIEINEQEKIEDNWLTREVASQLDKEVDDLTKQDFLYIKKIDLSYGKINDKIPKEISLLKNLEYLNLNYAKINEIPEELGDLQKLTYLDLGDNKLRDLPENIENKVINGYYTYCNLDGNNFSLQEGWHFLNGKWCSLDRRGDKLTKSQTIDGKEYEFDKDGNVKLGWVEDGDNFYYYDQMKGMVKNDWQTVEGKWYYFDEDGVMQKGLKTIKGVKFYLKDNGEMAKGWQDIAGKMYYFTETGGMKYGWIDVNGDTYYLDEQTGEKAANEEKTINGSKYRFDATGKLMTNVWIDNYNYVQANGQAVNTYYDYSHSNYNYNLFKYMTDKNNRISVDNTAVYLHGGDTSNNCVFFASEALRRVGFDIPKSMANTYQFENELKRQGFVYSYDLSQLKPGDIVFTNNYSHVYIFMCWDKDGYAYIVDNQSYNFGGKILHRRNVLGDTSITDRATHFYYYPN